MQTEVNRRRISTINLENTLLRSIENESRKRFIKFQIQSLLYTGMSQLRNQDSFEPQQAWYMGILPSHGQWNVQGHGHGIMIEANPGAPSVISTDN